MALAAVPLIVGILAQGPPETAPLPLVSQQTRVIAEKYLKAYMAQDWDALEALVAPEFTFDDPTAAHIFGPVKRFGLAEGMSFFRSWPKLSWAFRPVRIMAVGRIAVIEGRVDWTFTRARGPRAGQQIRCHDAAYTLILRFEGGKVIEHVDHLDYHPLLEGLAAAPSGQAPSTPRSAQ